MGDTKASKNDFLIAWYDVLWRNIDRSMTGMWQILAPITVIGTGLWAVGADYLPLSLGGSATLLIAFWALNLTIDLNSWHRRNLYLLAAVERRFLDDADYGTLIPKGYDKPKQRWIMFYIIHGATFLVLLTLATIYLFHLCVLKEASCFTWIVLIGTLCVGILLSIWHLIRDTTSTRKMRTELFSQV